MKKETTVPTCHSKEEALALVNLIEKDSSQQMLPLLRDPFDAAKDWFMHVPEVFNESLDIKKGLRVGSDEKVWIQGKGFNFKPGQVFYDSPNGYNRWGDALRLIGHVIQIQNAIPAHKEGPGSVSFTLFRPNSAETAVEKVASFTVSQFQFVRILIDESYLPAVCS